MNWPEHTPYTLRSAGRMLGTPVHTISFEETEIEVFQAPSNMAQRIVQLMNIAYNIGLMEGRK